MSHGVLVWLEVLFGSPITIVGGKPNAGKVACKSVRKLARPCVNIVADFGEILRRRGEVGQVFSVSRDE